MEMNYDENVRYMFSLLTYRKLFVHMLMQPQTLHQLEEELRVRIVPGTEIMTDVGSHHFVKSSNRVLVPQPSDDPHDPLVNYPPIEQIDMTCSEEAVELTRYRTGTPFGNSPR